LFLDFRIAAIGADGDLRDGAQIAEITGVVPDDGYPGFVREIGRQMSVTFGATLRALPAEMSVRTGTTCGSRPPYEPIME
jgi:hypothetical protein